MPKVRLGEVLKIGNGRNYSALTKTGKYPVYGSGGLMGYTDNFLYDGESVLLPRKGTLDNIQYATGRFWTVDTVYFSKVSEDKVNPYYLYYHLKLLDLKNLNTGTGVPSMTQKSYEDIPLIISGLDMQKDIANILRSLDEKIELNNKINAKLEELARDLYNYWFVQFEFPDDNQRPYKTAGGAMVYNEVLKRKIPAGWTAKKLDDIITRIGTGLNPRKNFTLGNGDNYYVTIKNISNGKIVIDDRCDRVNDDALRIIDRRSDLQVGDVLFTSIEPVGATYLINEKPTNWNINESVFTIRANQELVSSEFLFQLLSSDHMKAFTTNSASGSVHKGIRHSVLRTFPLVYPSDKFVIDKFTTLTKPILRDMDNLDKESARLTVTRDWLLPMLMNGQAKVD